MYQTLCQTLNLKRHKKRCLEIGQDLGTKMAAEVDTLRLLAQPELTENRTARKSYTKDIKNKHSSRPVGGAETGSWGGEDSCGPGGTRTGGVWDERGRQSDN